VAGAAHRARAPGTGLAPVAYGSPAPEFTFDAGDGARRLTDLAGKPVVVNFWATWCHPCADELEAFAQLGRTYGGTVELLAISDESRDVAGAFLRSHGVDALVVADPEHRIFDRYGVTPIPVTVVLNRAGAVTHVSVGELDWHELEAAVEQAGAAPLDPTATESPSDAPT
jgi:cytochrome c biogenesis protein CcmG/thiol:disulfide interchange protein DsbE